MSGEVEKCPILHVCPKFDVFYPIKHYPKSQLASHATVNIAGILCDTPGSIGG